MAQNVTVQGASYSDVPAVILPKTGGGTAKFIDVTIITDDGNGNYSCNKTWAECFDIVDAGDTSAVWMDTYGSQGGLVANYYDSTSIYYTFLGQYDGVPYGDLIYHSNGTITHSIPSHATPVYTTKSITANGTYNASSDNANGYSSVTVNVSGGGSSWTKIGSTTELTVNTTSTSAASAGTIALGSGHFDKTKIIYVRIRDKSGKRSGYFYGSDSFFINWRNANSSTSTLSVCAQEYYRCNSDGTYTGTSGAYGVYGYSLTTDGTLTIRRRYNSTNTLTINSTYTIDVYELTPPLTLF